MTKAGVVLRGVRRSPYTGVSIPRLENEKESRMPDSVRVDKTKLKDQLEKNKKLHKEEYDEALTEYKKNLLKSAQEMVGVITDSTPESLAKKYSHSIGTGLHAPEDHSDDYSRALEMLDWEIGDEIKLTHEEFVNIVQDDWEWKHQHRRAYFSNTGKSSMS